MQKLIKTNTMNLELNEAQKELIENADAKDLRNAVTYLLEGLTADRYYYTRLESIRELTETEKYNRFACSARENLAHTILLKQKTKTQN